LTLVVSEKPAAMMKAAKNPQMGPPPPTLPRAGEEARLLAALDITGRALLALLR
jgi:hypothetical protein